MTPPSPLARRSLLLDGEVIAATEDAGGDFQLLQARMNVARPTPALMAAVPVVFVAFDLLWLDGQDLTGRPLWQRREALDYFLRKKSVRGGAGGATSVGRSPETCG